MRVCVRWYIYNLISVSTGVLSLGVERQSSATVNVLELGAGVGLVGLLTGRLGCEVIMTDLIEAVPGVVQ